MLNCLIYSTWIVNQKISKNGQNLPLAYYHYLRHISVCDFASPFTICVITNCIFIIFMNFKSKISGNPKCLVMNFKWARVFHYLNFMVHLLLITSCINIKSYLGYNYTRIGFIIIWRVKIYCITLKGYPKVINYLIRFV